MHRTAYIAIIILSLGLVAPAQAAPNPVMVANAMFPASPCVGRITVAFDPAVGLRGRAEEAAINNTALYALSCVITFDPAAEHAMTPMTRCATYVHGAGHLAGLEHTAAGIMSANGANEYFEPCATIRDRVMHRLERPGVDYVICGKLVGNLMRCRAVQKYKTVRYRVRIYDEQFAIKRVR